MTTWEWDIDEKDVIAVTWSNLASGETIVTSTWEVPDELENLQATISDNVTLLKLRYTGNQYPKALVIRNVITTAGHPNGERKNGQSFRLEIVKR